MALASRARARIVEVDGVIADTLAVEEELIGVVAHRDSELLGAERVPARLLER